MFEERQPRRPRRVRRRRIRSDSDGPNTPSGDGESAPATTETREALRRIRGEGNPVPAGDVPRAPRPEGAPDGPPQHMRHRRRPPREGAEGGNGGPQAGPRNQGPPPPRRRRRRVDSRGPRPEGIRDATASRLGAAENQEARRGNFNNRRRPIQSGRVAGPERPKGLDILKLLQQQVTIDPHQRYQLETTPDQVSMRVLDLIAPIGRGQRALIVSPPKAGKTTILIQVAEALHVNHPEVAVYALLVDERPEEVTHFRRSTHATVYAASSDMSTRDHISITEDCINTIVPPVLEGKDVVLLLDSITRLARAYNTVQGNSGRTLSGGLDATTMLAPRQIFGAARKVEDGGSLTILGTALVDTGSRMDEVIFQEFKGTGNTELVLSRDLFEKRIFPSVDIGKSGTRKEEKLYPEDQVGRLHKLRRLAASYPPDQAMLGLLKLMQRHTTNEELLASLAALE
jgi:transcription termination factor Rho